MTNTLITERGTGVTSYTVVLGGESTGGARDDRGVGSCVGVLGLVLGEASEPEGVSGSGKADGVDVCSDVKWFVSVEFMVIVIE